MAAGSGRAVVNPGGPGERVLRPLSDGNRLRHGDVLRIETGGGGGRGDPHERPAALVAQDVADGFVSQAAALRDYGVALLPDGRVDEAATAVQRGLQRAA